jgi:hypothetical protein
MYPRPCLRLSPLSTIVSASRAGEIIGGIGHEAEKRAIDQRRGPAASFQRRTYSEDDDAGDIEQIEQDCRGQLTALAMISGMRERKKLVAIMLSQMKSSTKKMIAVER